ncbi:helicase-exonuclease AddAB subunit AddA [Secundilactobacillus kimchicus]|uniref:helicase-exonuclease AddAB subunit AddA n=1 Tax=Secundilactobacillus kimchicus TaxID=528209 RepID=UPI001C0319F1|nr:helicase-exonuclease AddAB subunit AddA [Secundilactobacillus kimchicus]
MDYTKSQQAVLDTHHTNLLVSASAGSGKTRVLVDRVINMILAGESLENLLIVTFTRAAAKEMKDRIEVALRERISTSHDEDQRYLTRQLALLPVADISTMDAFCQRIVERYYYLIDLDPVFRILADASEGALLREEVWADVREQCYANDESGAFKRLVANFSNDRSDDGLTDLVEQVFFFMNAKPDPQAWLAELSQAYEVSDKGLLQTPLVVDHFIPMLRERLTALGRALTQNLGLAQDEQAEKVATYYEALVGQVNQLAAEAATMSWDSLREKIDAFSLGRRPAVTKKDPAYDGFQLVLDDVKQHHDQAKKALAELQALMPYGEAQTVAVMQDSQAIVATLADVVTQFASAYQQEKLRRHVLEFSDIEHFALQILTKDSAAARAVQDQLKATYHEIMVDEYQDTNELQEAIVTSIAQTDPGNLFMVGDIKQSIYGFRLAEPKLFINKFNHYQEDPEAGKEITLAENFRSMKNVDDFTNLIFTQLMDRNLGQIDYTGPAKLVYGATYYPEDLVKEAHVLVYETAAEVDRGQTEVPDKSAGQVAVVGQKIRELVVSKTEIWDRKAGVKRPMTYRDIAIIAPTRSHNLEIQDQFGQLNIPVQINDAESYFKTTEIQIMMALLQLIDNPYQDIALAAVLRSPIVGLNENELAYLRITDKTDDYYTALRHFVGQYELTFAGNGYADSLYPKVQQFLEQLSEFQDIARQQPIATLIWTIYQTTGFLDYVAGMPAGSQRQANLHALYDRARDYEQNGFKGLFQFVRFIERMQKNDNDLAEADTQATEDAVQVTTIHGSKGLEYPVVFLLDTSRQFNMSDTMGSAIMDNDLGIGINVLNPGNRVMAESIPKAIIRDKLERDTLAEEMRKLYVALTRAEQQLFIVGAVKTRESALKSWRDALLDDQLILSATTRRAKKTYLDWIGMALERHPKATFDSAAVDLAALHGDTTRFDVTFLTADDLVETQAQSRLVTGSTWLADLQSRAEGADYTDVAVDQIESVLNLQYRFAAETRTTAYQSVSEIKRVFEDPDLTQLGNYAPDWQHHQGNRFVSKDFKRPAFLQTVQAPTGAEVGTATHLVLQELSLTEPVTIERVAQQIQELVTGGVLTAEVAAKINREQILSFFDSELGKTVMAHRETLRRETPFSLLLPAKDIFSDLTDEAPRLLIHGIIDGYYLNDDGTATLFDYKTDYVPQTETGVTAVVDRYKGQLNLYALALGKMLGRPVSVKALYLLAVNQEVLVD